MTTSGIDNFHSVQFTQCGINTGDYATTHGQNKHDKSLTYICSKLEILAVTNIRQEYFGQKSKQPKERMLIWRKSCSVLTFEPSLTRNRKRSEKKIVPMINTRVSAASWRNLQEVYVTNCSPWTRPQQSPFFQSTSWGEWNLLGYLSREIPYKKTQEINKTVSSTESCSREVQNGLCRKFFP